MVNAINVLDPFIDSLIISYPLIIQAQTRLTKRVNWTRLRFLDINLIFPFWTLRVTNYAIYLTKPNSRTLSRQQGCKLIV